MFAKVWDKLTDFPMAICNIILALILSGVGVGLGYIGSLLHVDTFLAGHTFYILTLPSAIYNIIREHALQNGLHILAYMATGLYMLFVPILLAIALVGSSIIAYLVAVAIWSWVPTKTGGTNP